MFPISVNRNIADYGSVSSNPLRVIFLAASRRIVTKTETAARVHRVVTKYNVLMAFVFKLVLLRIFVRFDGTIFRTGLNLGRGYLLARRVIR